MHLPNEIILQVFKQLDVPSRICLGLTSKFFAAMSRMVDTTLTDQQIVVKFHANCPNPPCVYTTHISDRRLLLLSLKSYMPRGYRLCWKCALYTKITKSQWYSTTWVRFDSQDALDLETFRKIRSNQIWAHANCVSSGRHLAVWSLITPGASGGFSRFLGTTNPPTGGHIYHHC